jgi:hypothetical protein
MDAGGAKDECASRGRRSHVVLTPRRWRQILEKLTLLGDDGDKKPDRRGERGISRKTITQGMPDVSGVTVVTNARVFYHHARLRARQWSGFDIRNRPSRQFVPRMSNPKLHCNIYLLMVLCF